MAATFIGKVPPNSASLEEARKRVFDFFKIACRSLPSVMEIYNLHDVVTVSQLRSTIAAEIRKNSHVNDPKFLPSLILLDFFRVFTVDTYFVADLVDHFSFHSFEYISLSGSIFHSQVIDMLIFKGVEELGNIVEHSKQRHHILGQNLNDKGSRKAKSE
ncbi:hypothetical protein Cgig2_011857 [Carnegiea gigantea]|uniref:Uncharacterized protein n=1 Tax=Carnegiea gigantea TaxID=171969 RepID=A0A9Q1JFL5_9CARY|nr:hypothetical protein Cgig2_011857 [Carnegiea gigantea]